MTLLQKVEKCGLEAMLVYGRKRNTSSSGLNRRYQDTIPRRDLMALISEERTAVQ